MDAELGLFILEGLHRSTRPLAAQRCRDGWRGPSSRVQWRLPRGREKESEGSSGWGGTGLCAAGRTWVKRSKRKRWGHAVISGCSLTAEKCMVQAQRERVVSLVSASPYDSGSLHYYQPWWKFVCAALFCTTVFKTAFCGISKHLKKRLFRNYNKQSHLCI